MDIEAIHICRGIRATEFMRERQNGNVSMRFAFSDICLDNDFQWLSARIGLRG